MASSQLKTLTGKKKKLSVIKGNDDIWVITYLQEKRERPQKTVMCLLQALPDNLGCVEKRKREMNNKRK